MHILKTSAIKRPLLSCIQGMFSSKWLGALSVEELKGYAGVWSIFSHLMKPLVNRECLLAIANATP